MKNGVSVTLNVSNSAYNKLVLLVHSVYLTFLIHTGLINYNIIHRPLTRFVVQYYSRMCAKLSIEDDNRPYRQILVLLPKNIDSVYIILPVRQIGLNANTTADLWPL